MTSSDEGQDQELLERYRRATAANALVPSASVRAAILEEGRRVAATFPPPVGSEPARPRASRWKMTVWGTAAAALLAALIIAPRLWNQSTPRIAGNGIVKNPFNEAASKAVSPESAEPRPVVPVVPVPAPKLEDIRPLARLDANAVPTLHQPTAPPPPIHIPEKSVEVAALDHSTQGAMPGSRRQELTSIADARSVNPSFLAGVKPEQQSPETSRPVLFAAAAAGDVRKTTQLLDQGAAINDQDASGRTPLMLAIGQHRLEMVRLLLMRGADPNAADQHGVTPLQLAQQSHYYDVARLLIEGGAR